MSQLFTAAPSYANVVYSGELWIDVSLSNLGRAGHATSATSGTHGARAAVSSMFGLLFYDQPCRPYVPSVLRFLLRYGRM